MKIPVRALVCVLASILLVSTAFSATPKRHAVVLGAAKKVAYSQADDPASAAPGEDSLLIRALLVDGAVKEWTTGDAHDVTDRNFLVRRAIRLNNALPGDKTGQWVWQRGPWLLVSRTSGRITALNLPDYAPGVSQVTWFRDYGAYCGVSPSGKSLYAVVAQLGARRPARSRKLATFDPENHPQPVCAAPEWQRDPMRITFHLAGKDPIAFNFVPGSAVLVGDSDEETGGSSPLPSH